MTALPEPIAAPAGRARTLLRMLLRDRFATASNSGLICGCGPRSLGSVPAT